MKSKTIKYFSLVLSIAIAISCICVPCALAADNNSDESESGFLFNGKPMNWILCDENGNIVRTSYERKTYNTAIPNGHTLFFYTDDGSSFNFIQYTAVSFKVTWASNAQYIMGYDVGRTGSGTVACYQTANAEKTHTAIINIPKTAG